MKAITVEDDRIECDELEEGDHGLVLYYDGRIVGYVPYQHLQCVTETRTYENPSHGTRTCENPPHGTRTYGNQPHGTWTNRVQPLGRFRWSRNEVISSVPSRASR
jgi:hypothetical protein